MDTATNRGKTQNAGRRNGGVGEEKVKDGKSKVDVEPQGKKTLVQGSKSNHSAASWSTSISTSWSIMWMSTANQTQLPLHWTFNSAPSEHNKVYCLKTTKIRAAQEVVPMACHAFDINSKFLISEFHLIPAFPVTCSCSWKISSTCCYQLWRREWCQWQSSWVTTILYTHYNGCWKPISHTSLLVSRHTCSVVEHPRNFQLCDNKP